MQQIAGFSMSTLHNRVSRQIKYEKEIIRTHYYASGWRIHGDWESNWSQFQKVFGPSFSELFLCWHFKSAPNSEILAQGKDN